MIHVLHHFSSFILYKTPKSLPSGRLFDVEGLEVVNLPKAKSYIAKPADLPCRGGYQPPANVAVSRKVPGRIPYPPGGQENSEMPGASRCFVILNCEGADHTHHSGDGH